MGVAWTRLGTVSVTAGSVNVQGVDTRWQTAASIGDAFHGPDGKQYEVAAITSDTALQLRTPYQGATAAGQAYAIMRIVPQGSDAETMALLRQVLNLTDTQLSAFMEWADSQGVVSISDGETALPGLHGLRKLMADIALRVPVDSAGRVGLGVSPAFQFQIGKSSLDIAPGANPLVVLTNPAYTADTGVTLGFGFTQDSIGVALTGRSLASAGGGEFEVATRSSAGALAPRCRFGASGVDVFGVMAADGFRHRSYTRATVPSASAYARCTIYVSDAVGGASPAWSDGTTWTSFKTNAAI